MYKINIECELILNTFSTIAIEKIKKFVYKEVDFNYNMDEVDNINVSIDRGSESLDIQVFFIDDEDYFEVIEINYSDFLDSIF